MDNEEDIIKEIKEKIKNNPKYVNPCSKLYQEDIKKYGFENGYRFSCWLQQVGILKNPTTVRQRQKDDWAKSIGFENFNDYRRDWYHETGRCLPSDVNEDCPAYLGEFTENLMIHRYPNAKKMCYENPGFDYIWNEIKIDVKGKCITHRPGRLPNFNFPIRYNDIPHKFILAGYENRDNLNPLYAWEFDSCKPVKYGTGKGYILKNFWERMGFTIGYTSIGYTSEGLSEFKDHQININEIINRTKEE